MGLIETALFPAFEIKKDLMSPKGHLTLLVKRQIGWSDMSLGLLLLILMLPLIAYVVIKIYTHRIEIKHDALIENLQDLIIILDKDGVILWSSPATRHYGMEPAEALGINVIEYVHPDDKARFDQAIDYTVDHPVEVLSLEAVKAITPGGDLVYLRYTFQYLPDTPGINGIVVVIHDVTEQKNAEFELRDNAEYLQTIIETSQDGILVVDKDGYFEFGNTATADILGWPEDEYIGSLFIKVIPPDLHTFINERWQEAQAGKGGPYEVDIIQKSGKRRSLYVSHTHMEISGERKYCLVIKDVSTKKQAEKAIRESQLRYKNFITHASEGIYRIDMEPPVPVTLPKQALIERINQSALIAEANQALARMYSLTVEDMVDQPAVDFAPNYGERACLALEGEDYSVVDIETKNIDKNGQTIFLLESYHGEVIDKELHRIWGVQRNITKRKIYADELARLNELYSDLANNKLMGIYRIRVSSRRDRDHEAWDDSKNPPFVFEFINDKFCEIFNLNRQELDKYPGFITDFVYEDDRAGWIDENVKASIKNIPFKWDGRFLIDGEICWLHLESMPRRLESGDTIWTGICFDVTERKRAEQKLIEAHKLIEGVIEQSPIPMVVASPDGELKIFNEAVIEQLGIPEDSEIKRGVNLLDFKQPWKDYGVDGKFIPIEQLPLAMALKGKAVKDLELRVVRSDGTERWDIASSTPIYDDNGNLIAGFVAFPDITELKRSEATLKRYADTQAVLLREVNHRVKNNLSAIIGMLLKERDRTDAEGVSTYLDVLGDLIARIEGLSTVHSMLSASGWSPLNLTELCERIILTALQSHYKNKTVSVVVNDSDITVSSNQAHHLTLVINELTTNVIKHALSEGETGQISVNILRDDKTVRIVFRDDGPGYPEEIVAGDLSSANIGFDLILGIVNESLRGKVLFENDNGATTTIVFKLETLDEMEA